MKFQIAHRMPYGGRKREWLALAATLAAFSCPAAPVAKAAAENLAPRVSIERSGELQTAEGLTLRLNADLGSVTIETLPPDAQPVVRYTVHIETDAREAVAHALLERYALFARGSASGIAITGALPTAKTEATKNSQFWVQFVVTVPAHFNLDIHTGGGDIETSDIAGHVLLNTEGGNIRTGRIGTAGQPAGTLDHPVARVVTQGGHITVMDVYGDLDAFTAGGHIQAGDIDGSARLRTGGGHIRAGRIKAAASLDTGGGNITVGEADATLAVRTGGGQIDLGEIHGSIRAQTAGGGIRGMYIAGPMEMETNGGSICLTRVANTVRAVTGAGTITAWITPDTQNADHVVKMAGPSQFASSTGDIVVFLPRNLAVTIDATVENGGAARIESDPALPLTVQAQPDGPVHALGNLNGGGPLLKLRTTAGKIHVQFVGAESALRESLQEEQKMRLARRLNDAGVEQVNLRTAAPGDGESATPASTPEDKRDWMDTWMARMEVAITGGVHEDTDEFKKRIKDCCRAPEYPTIAKRAGIQGLVRLQVRVRADGSVDVDKVLEGQPMLAEAATAAVRQWRAAPEDIAGKKVDVISTVTFNFQLH